MSLNPRVVYTAEQIRQRVAGLGKEVTAGLDGQRPLVVGVLNGSLIFLADLVRSMDCEVDVDFLSVSSYPGGVESSGVVRITKDLEFAIEDRHVLIVEDIVDTGLTLSFLLRTLKDRNPGSLEVCSMIDKPARRIAMPTVDHAGFSTEEFLVGYGLDFKGRYRNLPFMVGIDNPVELLDQPGALDGFFEQVSP